MGDYVRVLKSVKYLFIAGTVLLLVLTMSLSYFLNISGLKKNYDDSVNSKYSVLGENSILIIEYAIQYGKSLQRYSGIENLLGEILKKDDLIESVIIFDNSGQVLSEVSKSESVKGNLENETRKAFFSEENKGVLQRIEKSPQQHLLMPIFKGEVIVGGLEIVLNDQGLYENVRDFTKVNQRTTIWITFGASLLLLVILRGVKVFEVGKDRRKTLLFILMGVMLLTQTVYTFSNLTQLRGVYKEIAFSNAKSVTLVVEESVGKLINNGLTWDEFEGIDQWLAAIVHRVPDIEQITLFNDKGALKYQNQSLAGKKNPNYMMRSNLKLQDQTFGDVQVLVSKDYIDRKLIDVLLDSISIVIASILFYIELSFLMIYLLNKSLKNKDESEIVEEESAVLIRNLAFLFIFATDLSLSFIPIMSQNFALEGSGVLSESIAMALPIQMEMLGTSIMALVTGFIIDKNGWKPSFLMGVLVVAIGSLMCAFSPNLWIFMLARGLVGVGYGLSWTSLAGYIGKFKSEKARRSGFADLIAGIYAGSNCGVVLGAMLSERFNYRIVFILAVVLVMISGLIGLKFVKNVVEETGVEMPHYPYSRFFKDTSVWKFILLISLPGMAMIMFLNYFVPLYSKTLDISPSNLGRLFLLYGVSMIYVGPFLIRELGKRLNSRQMLILGGLIVGVSLLVFSQNISIPVLILVIILISIADSFAITSKTAYFTELDASVKLGRGKAIGILGTARKFGMMIGTNIFGLALVFSAKETLGLISIIYIILVLTFTLLTWNKSKKGGSAHHYD